MPRRPSVPIPMDLVSKEDFFNGTLKRGTCIEWIYPRNSSGYGVIYRNKRNYSAHRVSWVIHNGPIPSNMLVCHKCDNPSCVNPDHLFIGTTLDNSLDMISKRRGIKYKSKIDEKTVQEVLSLLNKKLTKLSIKQRLKISFKAIESIEKNFFQQSSETSHLEDF